MSKSRSRWMIGSNLFASGIVELWFNAIVYGSVAAAFGILASRVQGKAWILAGVSYLLAVVYVVFKSRQVYENLLQIYVHTQPNRFFAWIAASMLFACRLGLLVLPVILFFWFGSIGNVPI